ncbi:MAG TPA: SRPBCC family protein [Dongiaceae bacterium]|jgi:uncharacterized protein YndB with AHSA1/START domain
MATTSKETRIAPVRKTLTVPLSPEKAFRLFTAGIATWWPLATHSVGESKAETVIMESRAGGRFYERAGDGSIAIWGEVRVWDPPRRLVYSWHPGRGAATAQEVELRFAREGKGTRVQLEHRGWEVLGEKAYSTRDNYDTGWNRVLNECYGKAAGIV